MNQDQPSNAYKNEEDKQLTHILLNLMWALSGAYLYAIFIGLFYSNSSLIAVSLAGCILLIVPLIMLKRQFLRASSIVIVLSVIGTVTMIASVGQGIHDLVVVAFPVILIFAGLTLDRKFFRVCVGLTLGAVCWLSAGEVNGWFVTKPFVGNMTAWFYLVGVIIILLVAALAVESLVMNMRKSLERAQSEIAQRAHVEEQLRYQGAHDFMTNIYNRAFFMGELERLERSRDNPISIIVVDVDNLKIVNDSRGHAAGDVLLRQAADVLRSVFRGGDVLARIGGDEFAILLPTANSATALQMLARVREQLDKHNSQYPDSPLQLSLGAATTEKSDLKEALMIADQRMYSNKTARKSKGNPESDMTDSTTDKGGV